MGVRHFVCRFFAPVMACLLLAGCQTSSRVPVPPAPAEIGSAAVAGGAVAAAGSILDDSYDLATAQYYAGQAMRRQACFAQKRTGTREAEATAMVGGHVAETGI